MFIAVLFLFSAIVAAQEKQGDSFDMKKYATLYNTWFYVDDDEKKWLVQTHEVANINSDNITKDGCEKAMDLLKRQETRPIQVFGIDSAVKYKWQQEKMVFDFAQIKISYNWVGVKLVGPPICAYFIVRRDGAIMRQAVQIKKP